MIDALPQDKLVSLTVTPWAIWSARRKAIHEAIFQSPLATYLFVQRFIADLESIKATRTTASKTLLHQ